MFRFFFFFRDCDLSPVKILFFLNNFSLIEKEATAWENGKKFSVFLFRIGIFKTNQQEGKGCHTCVKRSELSAKISDVVVCSNTYRYQKKFFSSKSFDFAEFSLILTNFSLTNRSISGHFWQFFFSKKCWFHSMFITFCPKLYRFLSIFEYFRSVSVHFRQIFSKKLIDFVAFLKLFSELNDLFFEFLLRHHRPALFLGFLEKTIFLQNFPKCSKSRYMFQKNFWWDLFFFSVFRKILKFFWWKKWLPLIIFGEIAGRWGWCLWSKSTVGFRGSFDKFLNFLFFQKSMDFAVFLTQIKN